MFLDYQRSCRMHAQTARQSTDTGFPKWRAVSLRVRGSVASAAALAPSFSMAAISARNLNRSIEVSSRSESSVSASATACKRRLPSCW